MRIGERASKDREMRRTLEKKKWCYISVYVKRETGVGYEGGLIQGRATIR